MGKGIGTIAGGGLGLLIGGPIGAGIGASIGSGLDGSAAASDAADAQMAAAAQASQTQRYMYDQTRKDQEPWRQAGVDALGKMQSSDFQRDFTMEDFHKDPGYDFRMAEGQKALERSAAARGGLNSGATMKALTRYGQDFGSSEYDKAYNRFNNDRTTRFNRLASLSGSGQTANAGIAAAGANAANNISSNQLASGNAQAAGYIGQANAMSNGLGQGMNTWMNYTMMNRAFPEAGKT